jgi:hypothetical protein
MRVCEECVLRDDDILGVARSERPCERCGDFPCRGVVIIPEGSSVHTDQVQARIANTTLDT